MLKKWWRDFIDMIFISDDLPGVWIPMCRDAERRAQIIRSVTTEKQQ